MLGNQRLTINFYEFIIFKHNVIQSQKAVTAHLRSAQLIFFFSFGLGLLQLMNKIKYLDFIIIIACKDKWQCWSNVNVI